MKLSIPQPDLLAAINRVRGVVEARNTIPVLTFLKIGVDGETLTITATDMDIQARARAVASIDAPGETLIESAKLYDFVRRIPANREGGFALQENKATIKAGRSRATLATLPVDQFPAAKSEIYGNSFRLRADDIRHVLFRPMAAASDEEILYYLCGVFLHTDESELRGVATDGHKMIRTVMEAPPHCCLEPGVIIPSKALNVLQKCLDDNDVQVEADSVAVRFSTGVEGRGVFHVMSQPSLLLTRDDAAKLLGVSVPILYRLVEQGMIGRVKVVTQWRYPKAELERFVAEQVVYERGQKPCPSGDEQTTTTGSSTSRLPAENASGRPSTNRTPSDKWRPRSAVSDERSRRRRQRAPKVLHIDGAT